MPGDAWRPFGSPVLGRPDGSGCRSTNIGRSCYSSDSLLSVLVNQWLLLLYTVLFCFVSGAAYSAALTGKIACVNRIQRRPHQYLRWFYGSSTNSLAELIFLVVCSTGVLGLQVCRLTTGFTAHPSQKGRFSGCCDRNDSDRETRLSDWRATRKRLVDGAGDQLRWR